MSQIPADLLYTKEHEWVRVEGDVVTIGITDHAQSQLGDVVYVELPEAGDALEAEGPFGVVESVKAVSDLFAPVSGEVVESNAELVDTPEVVNTAPYTDAWMVKVRLADASATEGLMTAEQYATFVAEEAK